MRKICALFAALLMLLTLTACELTFTFPTTAPDGPTTTITEPTTAPTISTTIPTDPTSTPPYMNEEAFNIFTKCANDYQWGENVVGILMENIPDLDMKISVVELEDLHYKITVGDAEYFMELNAESREVLTITYEGIIIFPVE